MSPHPHIRCEKCLANYTLAAVVQFGCFVALPFVSPERAIAFAIVVLAMEYSQAMLTSASERREREKNG